MGRVAIEIEVEISSSLVLVRIVVVAGSCVCDVEALVDEVAGSDLDFEASRPPTTPPTTAPTISVVKTARMTQNVFVRNPQIRFCSEVGVGCVPRKYCGNGFEYASCGSASGAVEFGSTWRSDHGFAITSRSECFSGIENWRFFAKK